jgi:hypothetical protein
MESPVTDSMMGAVAPWMCHRIVVNFSSVATPALSAVIMTPAESTPSSPTGTRPLGILDITMKLSVTPGRWSPYGMTSGARPGMSDLTDVPSLAVSAGRSSRPFLK